LSKMPLAWNKKVGVPPNEETTIVSYSVAANKVVKLDGFIAFGTCPAIFRLYVGSDVKVGYMTSDEDRTAYVVFRTEHVSGATTIAIKVIHYSPAPGPHDYHDFEGTILGA